jgi:hypothetical protein
MALGFTNWAERPMLFWATPETCKARSMAAIRRMAAWGIISFPNRKRAARIVALLVGFSVPFLTFSDVRAQDKPVGSATTSDGKVRLDVLSLKRTEGETVTLRWQIINDGNEGYSMTPGNMKLLDIPGRRSYSPGVVSPSCSAQIGQRMTCYAVFGAPPAATKTMAVQFYEKIEMISGVPIGE